MKNKNLKDLILDNSMNPRNLSIESKLNALFDTDRQNREDRVGMHGSGVIASENEFCHRQQVLSFFFKGNEPEIPDNLKRIFLEGWYIHTKWQTLFKQAGIAVGIEQRGISKEWQLLFTPDAIIRLDNKLYVVEIKSVNTFQFKNMTSHPSGEKQCRLYMHFTGIPNGFVLAEDKNTQEFKVLPVDYDPLKVKPYVERMWKVIKEKEQYIKSGKLPQRVCQNEDCKKACKCSYRDCCFNLNKIPLDEKQMSEMKRRWLK